jgi:single-strand DNA-binding protein
VIVQGRLRQKSYENPDGEKRTSLELHADELAPSLRHATAKISKAARQSSGERDEDEPPF